MSSKAARGTRRAALALLLWAMATVAAASDSVPRIQASVSPPTAAPGGTVELEIEIVLPSGWIGFDLEQVAESAPPTRISLDPVGEITPIGGFRSSSVLEGRDDRFGGRLVRFFPGTARFRQRLELSPAARAGECRVGGRIDALLIDAASGRKLQLRQYPFSASFRVAEHPAFVAEAAGPATEAPVPTDAAAADSAAEEQDGVSRETEAAAEGSLPAPPDPASGESVESASPVAAMNPGSMSEPLRPASRPRFQLWHVASMLLLAGIGWAVVSGRAVRRPSRTMIP